MIERRLHKYDNYVRELAYASRYVLEALVTNVTPAVLPDDAEKLARAEEGAIREALTRLRDVERALTLRSEEVRYTLVRHDQERYRDVETEVQEVQQLERERPRQQQERKGT